MRMQRKWRGGVLFGLIFSLLLTGCGSGGEGEAPVAPPVAVGTAEGIFRGALVGNGQFGKGVFGVPDEFGQHEGMADFNMDEGSRLWANATGTYQEGRFLHGTMTLKVGAAHRSIWPMIPRQTMRRT